MKQELINFAKLLKDNGFTVLIPEEYKTKKYNWFTFFKHGKFGNICIDTYGYYWTFGTVHKPCKEVGTGYQILKDIPTEGLTLENALSSLCFAPAWAASSDLKAIVKYKSVEEYLNSSYNKIIKNVIF